MLNDTYTIRDLEAAQLALHGKTVTPGSRPLPEEVRIAEAIARARDDVARGAGPHLSAQDRSDLLTLLIAMQEQFEEAERTAARNSARTVATHLQMRVRRVRHLITLLAVLCLLVLTGCADGDPLPLEHAAHALQVQVEPGQALPLDVYLEDVPECDRPAWRAAVAAWNREAWVDALVLHEEPGAGRCGVYVGRGEPGWTLDGCVARLAYDPCELVCTAGHALGHALGLPDEEGEPRSVMHASCTFGLPNRFNGAAVREAWGIW